MEDGFLTESVERTNLMKTMKKLNTRWGDGEEGRGGYWNLII